MYIFCIEISANFPRFTGYIYIYIYMRSIILIYIYVLMLQHYTKYSCIHTNIIFCSTGRHYHLKWNCHTFVYYVYNNACPVTYSLLSWLTYRLSKRFVNNNLFTGRRSRTPPHYPSQGPGYYWSGLYISKLSDPQRNDFTTT